MDALKQLQAQHPHISVLSPSTPEYGASRKIFDLANKEEPLGIVTPKNAEEVAQIVKFAVANKIDFSVRVGGHDPLGRTVVSNALLVDLRPLDSVAVDEAAQTVTIGGGVVTGALLKKLHEKGFVAVVGSVPWVGYVGWCTMGGYGQLSGQFGLGVDNIVAAKIVNANGEIVTANDELLKGIRGAGGNFGVIVELTVNIFRLEKVSLYQRLTIEVAKGSTSFSLE
jgi:FAD/FMN-containing dehydrogenase